MSDYSQYSKTRGVTTYPVSANGTSGLFKRVEPLLTPAKFRSRFLKGIMENLPKNLNFSDEELKDRINLAVNELESELDIPVFPEQFKERHPFDYNTYKSYIHLKTRQGPIISLEDFAIVSANQQTLFRLPSEWIDTGQFHRGQINVIPLLAAYGVNSVTGNVANAGIAFLAAVGGGLHWLPSYWEVTYTAGMCNKAGQVPVIVNQLIGAMAAIDILSNIAPNNAKNSVALSQDGLSQSSSGPGNRIYELRIAELEKKKATLLPKLKRTLRGKYFINNA